MISQKIENIHIPSFPRKRESSFSRHIFFLDTRFHGYDEFLGILIRENSC